MSEQESMKVLVKSISYFIQDNGSMDKEDLGNILKEIKRRHK